MWILLLISLLSLIGVIKCRPQQTGGQTDITVESQLRYNRLNVQKTLPHHENAPKTFYTYPPLPLTVKAVRKNSPQNYRSLDNSRRRLQNFYNIQTNLKSNLVVPNIALKNGKNRIPLTPRLEDQFNLDNIRRNSQNRNIIRNIPLLDLSTNVESRSTNNPSFQL